MPETVGIATSDRPAAGDADFAAVLNQAIANRSRRVFPGLAAFLAFQALYDSLAQGLGDAGAELALMTILAAAVVYLGVFESTHKSLPVSSRTLVTAVAGLALTVQIAHIWLLQDLAFFLPFMGALLAAGFCVLAPAPLGITLSSSIGVWAAVTAEQFELVIWAPLTVAAALVGAWSVRSAASEVAELRTGHRMSLERAEAERQSRLELERRERSLWRDQRAIEAAGDGHWYWDLTDDKCYFSASWAGMLGFEPTEISEKPEEWLDRVHAHYLPQVKEDLSAHLYGRTPRFQSQFRLQIRGGSYIWALAKGVAERDEEGNPIGISGSLIEITHLIQAEKAMINDAFQDRLTGLANRKAFTIRLERAVERMRQEQYLFAVIFMDLDRFKVINDSHGHLVGDQLLASVASRLRNCLRERRGDILARFGGDEFVALLEDIREPEEALVVARRFRDVLRSPFKIGDHEITSGGSVGIAFNNTKIETASDLLRNADTAMYRAKAERKGEIQVFNSEMYEETVRLYAMENDLGRALDQNQFVLEYQPVVSMKTGDIVGCEALLRWRRSEYELVGPSEFIPLAEESGNIEAIGEWALAEAVRQNALWQGQGLRPVKVAVNLSAKQLRRPGLNETVQRILTTYGLDPSWLELELTETALMENLSAATEMIANLQKGGVRISIDDFGTGYSSLGYLRRFPFDSLKMDRTFVADMSDDPKSLAVAKGLIRLAHNLKLKVTAEGVETEQQLKFLARYGCDQFQGFLASRAVSARRFGEMLEKNERLVGPLAAAEPETVSIEMNDLGEALEELSSALTGSVRPEPVGVNSPAGDLLEDPHRPIRRLTE